MSSSKQMQGWLFKLEIEPTSEKGYSETKKYCSLVSGNFMIMDDQSGGGDMSMFKCNTLKCSEASKSTHIKASFLIQIHPSKPDEQDEIIYFDCKHESLIEYWLSAIESNGGKRITEKKHHFITQVKVEGENENSTSNSNEGEFISPLGKRKASAPRTKSFFTLSFTTGSSSSSGSKSSSAHEFSLPLTARPSQGTIEDVDDRLCTLLYTEEKGSWKKMEVTLKNDKLTWYSIKQGFFKKEIKRIECRGKCSVEGASVKMSDKKKPNCFIVEAHQGLGKQNKKKTLYTFYSKETEITYEWLKALKEKGVKLEESAQNFIKDVENQKTNNFTKKKSSGLMDAFKRKGSALSKSAVL